MNIQDYLDEFKYKFKRASSNVEYTGCGRTVVASNKEIMKFLESALTSYAKQEREKQKELDLTEMSELVNHAYTRSHPTERYREGFEDCQLSLRETLNMKIQYLHDQKDQ